MESLVSRISNVAIIRNTIRKNNREFFYIFILPEVQPMILRT